MTGGGQLETVAIGLTGGSIRASTPYLFVSLGECVTEKSDRINLGQEGILVLGAMVGYAGSYATGDPWLGVLAAGCAGTALGALHAIACSLPRVNDIAIGIWPLARGPDRANRRRQQGRCARAGIFDLGRQVFRDRGRRLSLRRRRRLSVAVLPRQLDGEPLQRTGIYGGRAGHFRALGPALQSAGVGQIYYLVGAAPYALTLAILIASSSRERPALGAPRELRAV